MTSKGAGLTAPEESDPEGAGLTAIEVEESDSEGASQTAIEVTPLANHVDFAVTVHHEGLGPTGMVACLTGEDLKRKVLGELWSKQGLWFDTRDVYIRCLKRNLHGEVVAGLPVTKDETVTSEMLLLGTILVVKPGVVAQTHGPGLTTPFTGGAGLTEPTTQAPDGASLTAPDMDVGDDAGRGDESNKRQHLG
jgi:hypothetical protein